MASTLRLGRERRARSLPNSRVRVRWAAVAAALRASADVELALAPKKRALIAWVVLVEAEAEAEAGFLGCFGVDLGGCWSSERAAEVVKLRWDGQR